MNPRTVPIAVVAALAVLCFCSFLEVQAQGLLDGMNYVTPSTPRPEDVNCYVEVRTTRQVGGRCGRMGQVYTCQAGPYLSPNPDCQSVMNGQSTVAEAP